MEINTLVIPVAFLILSSLLLWFVIDTKRRFFLKLTLIIIIPALSIMIWQSLNTYLGWPTKNDLPKKAILIWAVINEPSAKTGDPGSIYLWLTPLQNAKEQNSLFEYKYKQNEPRAYKIPYSREMHQRLQEAGELIRKGKIMGIEGMEGKEFYRYRNQDDDLRFYELPPPKLPEKEPIQ